MNTVTIHLIFLWVLLEILVCQHRHGVCAYCCGVSTFATTNFRLPTWRHQMCNWRKYVVPLQDIYSRNSTIHIQRVSVAWRAMKHARILTISHLCIFSCLLVHTSEKRFFTFLFVCIMWIYFHFSTGWHSVIPSPLVKDAFFLSLYNFSFFVKN